MKSPVVSCKFSKFTSWKTRMLLDSWTIFNHVPRFFLVSPRSVAENPQIPRSGFMASAATSCRRTWGWASCRGPAAQGWGNRRLGLQRKWGDTNRNAGNMVIECEIHGIFPWKLMYHNSLYDCDILWHDMTYGMMDYIKNVSFWMSPDQVIVIFSLIVFWAGNTFV